MEKQKIIDILSLKKDFRSNNNLSEIVQIDGISNTDQLLRIRFIIENIDSTLKQQYRKLLEDTLSEAGIEALVTIVTEKENAKTSPASNPQKTQINSFLPEKTMKRFKKIIAVYSTKGGVGKSTISAKLALDFVKKGLKTALIDLDIYGPSIPRILGVKGKVQTQDNKFIPAAVKGLHMMSVGLLVPNVDSPLIWRAPIVNGVVSQIFSDTLWDDEYDILVLDMPPGTGDIPITAGQSLSIDGILAVSTPQGIALEDTVKGLSMFKKFDIPILGFVYNMGSVICPDCHKSISIYPQNREFDEIMMNYEMNIIADLPLDPKVTALADAGELDYIDEESVWQKEFDKIVSAMMTECIATK